MTEFKNLLVWEKAHALALHAHRVSKGIRRTLDAHLRSQMVRAASSIPANIAEGRRHHSQKEFARFLRIAVSSAWELEYHIILARDLELIADDESAALLRETIEVRKMLSGLMKKIGFPYKTVTLPRSAV